MIYIYRILIIILLSLPGLAFGGSRQASEGNSLTEAHEDIAMDKKANRLINESSPYLIQHAYNPVDWYPWSDEALERARREGKPIFLSIGYAACHWCHVMEKESFENEAIAAFLNEHFVSIKVDREERPDLDQIYMVATQAMTGGGGWPMSVFLTPDLKPFYAGTYFPPDDRYGRPGFMSVLTELSRAFRDDRGRVEGLADNLTTNLREHYAAAGDTATLAPALIEQTAGALMNGYDKVHGGFGRAPKFPHPTELSFLLKYAVINNADKPRRAVLTSLEKMAHGGIYDQLGGGFHRYSTDERWLVPHFEKMLYDNALLSALYAEAYQATGDSLYLRIVRETLDFVRREMSAPEGGFYSSLDADSDGGEGRFYVWTSKELEKLLGPRADIFARYFNVTESGNFEDQANILNIDRSSEDARRLAETSGVDFDKVMDEAKAVLMKARDNRVRPFTDDKILLSWNGLMISGFVRGFQVTRNEDYRTAALKAAAFIRENLYDGHQLKHAYRDGRTGAGPFLEDYAYYIAGLIDLYEITHDFAWIDLAAQLAEKALVLFGGDDGRLYLAAAGNDNHYIRPQDIADGALPSPGSILIQSLIRLSGLTGNERFEKKAEQALEVISSNIAAMPQAMVSAVEAFARLISERLEIVIVGSDNRDSFLDEVYGRYLPRRQLIVSDSGQEKSPLLEGRAFGGTTMAYLCRNRSCLRPASSPEEFKRQLEQLH